MSDEEAKVSILDEAMGLISPNMRRAEFITAKENTEKQLLSQLGSMRLQQDVIAAKRRHLEQEMSDEGREIRVKALEQNQLLLEDYSEGAEALALELKRINEALAEMDAAGTSQFNNRQTRRKKS